MQSSRMKKYGYQRHWRIIGKDRGIIGNEYGDEWPLSQKGLKCVESMVAQSGVTIGNNTSNGHGIGEIINGIGCQKGVAIQSDEKELAG